MSQTADNLGSCGFINNADGNVNRYQLLGKWLSNTCCN